MCEWGGGGGGVKITRKMHSTFKTRFFFLFFFLFFFFVCFLRFSHFIILNEKLNRLCSCIAPHKAFFQPENMLHEKRLGRRCRSKNFKMAAMAASLEIGTERV